MRNRFGKKSRSENFKTTLSIASIAFSAFACYFTYVQAGLTSEQAEISRQALTSDRRNEAMYEFVDSIDSLCLTMVKKFEGSMFSAEQTGPNILVRYGKSMDAQNFGYSGERYSDVLHLRLEIASPTPKLSIWFSAAELQQLRSLQSPFELEFDKQQLYAINSPIEKMAAVFGMCVALKSKVISWYQRKDGMADEFSVQLVEDPSFFYHTVEAF